MSQNNASKDASLSRQGLGNVTNVIAIASGKGGVGKSTTAVNVALAVAAKGYRVGILDGDIYGPSLGLMLGLRAGTHPETMGEYGFVPLTAHGIKVMSMAFMVDENSPMVWRGPMAAGALQQMLLQSEWGELDFLFVDMPPGTGDIQLTLSQKAQLAGAVIVTTPQDLALLDAKKGIEMFAKVNVPVLGVVENMSIHVCSNCGHEEHIFGTDGGAKLADQYDTKVLAHLPLTMQIRQQVDAGQPSVVADPDGSVARIYLALADTLVDQLGRQAAKVAPVISIED